jgi:hypothetical protein
MGRRRRGAPTSTTTSTVLLGWAATGPHLVATMMPADPKMPHNALG